MGFWTGGSVSIASASEIFCVLVRGAESSSSSLRRLVPAAIFHGTAGRLVPFAEVLAKHLAAGWLGRPQRWHPRVAAYSLSSPSETPWNVAASNAHRPVPPYSPPLLPSQGVSFSASLPLWVLSELRSSFFFSSHFPPGAGTLACSCASRTAFFFSTYSAAWYVACRNPSSSVKSSR